MKNIYQLDLFETIYVKERTSAVTVMRVPGGWIIDKVFVPYHNEFQESASYVNVNLGI